MWHVPLVHNISFELNMLNVFDTETEHPMLMNCNWHDNLALKCILLFSLHFNGNHNLNNYHHVGEERKGLSKYWTGWVGTTLLICLLPQIHMKRGKPHAQDLARSQTLQTETTQARKEVKSSCCLTLQNATQRLMSSWTFWPSQFLIFKVRYNKQAVELIHYNVPSHWVISWTN